MRIAILQGAFFPVPAILGGAVEKIWYRMGKEFAALGHEVVHIGRDHSDLATNEYVSGVQYIRIPGYDTPSSLIKLKFLDLLYSIHAIKKIPKDADIIVTNTFWAPLLLRGKLGKKVYVSVERTPKGQMKLYSHVGRLRGCSVSIYDSIKEEISLNLYSIVSCIPNPIPFDVTLRGMKREQIILFVGRLHPEKGIHVLIEAFNLIKRDLSNSWKVIVVGSSDYKDGGGGDVYLQRLLKLSENNNIQFVGPIFNEEELVSYYERASIFCYPSQQGSGEAAPVAPREAMAYGCVPVVSKLECFNDFIYDGRNGLIYDHKSSNQAYELSKTLSSLLEDNLSIESFSKEAKLVSQRFSPRQIAKEFIEDFYKIYSDGEKY